MGRNIMSAAIADIKETLYVLFVAMPILAAYVAFQLAVAVVIGGFWLLILGVVAYAVVLSVAGG